MASTPTPPQCSAVPPKPSQSERYSENNNHNRHHRNQSDHHNRRQNNPYLGANKVAITKSSTGAASSGAANPSHSTPGSAFSWKSTLSSEFSGRRSTRFVSKTHSGRPRTGSNPHTPAGEEALRQILNYCNDAATLECMLIDFLPKLSRNSDDYTYLIRELGEAGHGWKSSQCFEFAMRREHRWHELGRLTSTMISTLGKMGNIELAVRIFETGRRAGYGNTVFSFTAMVSAFGRCGLYEQAVSMFEHMKKLGLRPNLVTYNAVIDAGAKGGVEFNRVVKHFEEMLAKSILPDRITYNSLLAVCSKSGLWEVARNLFNEMMERELDQDIFTYNTLLDVLCKSGQMDFAMEIMAEMPTRKIFPNVVTYSTVIDGLAKVGRLEEALNLFSEMKFLSINLDRISYNTLLSIYARLGRFEEAINVCKEMESVGIERDAATYNALLGGYGKHGKYDELRRTFEQMKAENIRPNLLTYSTMIDVYCKGGLYREAMDVFKEFKQVGLKADVVLYSSLIDSLCKNGLVKSAVMLLDEMTEEGIRPNVVTYNTIIDAFGWSAALERGFDSSFQADEHRIGPSSSMIIAGPFQKQVDDKEDHQIIQMFGQLSAEKAGHLKKDTRGRKDMHCILWLFKQMHELEIKPNVVTFSAILNACSRFNSFVDTSVLLEELRLFDNHVYGVAHGLLMGYRENIWFQALSLFDEVKHMDSSTASAFYNALTDMLWHYDQKRGAQLVVLEGKRRNVWGEGVWSDSCLDLHLMSCGAACAMVHSWLLNIRTVVFEGCELPNLLSILTGWGKHSKVVGDGTLRRAVEALLNGMGAPFHIAETNLGRFISPGYVVASWMKQWSTLNVLVLHDHRSYPEGARSGQVNNLQAPCL